MSRPSVAVIVLNYNGKEFLERYLHSVVDLDYENFRVIVADNDSTDDSVTFVREEFPEVEVVETGGNYGFSKGYNVAAETTSDVDYLWLINNDLKVTESSLSRLVDHVESEPDTAIVMPRINHMESETIQSLGFHYDVFGRSYPKDAGRTSPTKSVPHEIAYAMGSALMIDRTVWNEIGGFDDENFFYGDDDYLCLQAWLRGYHVEVVPESVVYHEREGVLGNERSRFDVYNESRNCTRTYLKLLQSRSILVGFPGYFGKILAQAGKDAVARGEPGIAYHRLSGFATALSELPEILQDRRRIQRHRVYDDERFLDPPFGLKNP